MNTFNKYALVYKRVILFNLIFYEYCSLRLAIFINGNSTFYNYSLIYNKIKILFVTNWWANISINILVAIFYLQFWKKLGSRCYLNIVYVTFFGQCYLFLWIRNLMQLIILNKQCIGVEHNSINKEFMNLKTYKFKFYYDIY